MTPTEAREPPTKKPRITRGIRSCKTIVSIIVSEALLVTRMPTARPITRKISPMLTYTVPACRHRIASAIAAVKRIPITRNHRGAVRIPFRNEGSPAAPDSGKDIGDEASRVEPEKEDAGGVGDKVMAVKGSYRRRMLPDESDVPVVPIHPRRGDQDGSERPKKPHGSVDAQRQINRSTASRSAAHFPERSLRFRLGR